MHFLVTGGLGFIGWRVARALIAREIPVMVADWNIEPAVRQHLETDRRGLVQFITCDISEFHNIASVLNRNPGITHVLHLAYLMSAEVEANPYLGARVNVVGMINVLEAALMWKLSRLVFASSEAVYGASQQVYGNRPISESEFCSPQDHFFTYGMMKVLNEFMADKYVRQNGLSIACARPPVVFGHGRKRGSLSWAEQFVSLPAIGQPVVLPFSADNRDCWLYVDDCAEQLVRLALKPRLSHFVYNNGGHSVSAREFASVVRSVLPDAQIAFDERIPSTPLVDNLDGSRLRDEIEFEPRSLRDGIRAHIAEARASKASPNASVLSGRSL